MTVLFRFLGVDYVQWKAVTRTLLRLDFRLPLGDRGASLGKIGDLIATVIVLGLFGLGAAVVVFFGGDMLVTATIVLIYLSVMLATTLLTQHGATLLSTADYVILGPRPVTSRTFLAIRVTNILFHALLTTSLMAYPAVIAYTMVGRTSVWRGVAAALSIYAWAVALAMALVVSYSVVLQSVGQRRFQRALGYLQMAAGFLAYGSLFLIGRALTDSSLNRLALPDRWWIALFPPAWYASYVELATGVTNSTTWVRAALSLLFLAALIAPLRGKLGLDYARYLSDLPVAAAPDASGVARTPFFPRGEARAVAILVLSHFRHDTRVRMGILAIVPLVLLYTLLGIRGQLDLVGLAVLLFPALLMRHFIGSESYQAAWIYRVTPADRRRLIVGLKNIAVGYFLLPFLILIAVVFAWRTGDVVRGVVQTAIIGLLGHIALQGAIIISPRLPFELPPEKTASSMSLMVWLVFIIVGGQGALMALDRWVYLGAPRIAGACAALIGIVILLNRVLAWRVRRL